MSENTTNPEVAAPAADAGSAPAAETKPGVAALDEAKPQGEKAGDATKSSDEPKTADAADKPADSATEKTEPATEEKTTDTDVELKDSADGVAAPEGDNTQATSTETPNSKAKGGRRKSTAGEGKGKGLNRKGSKARLTHTDAKPGDHFLVKLKGFPAWPAIICDESMLPHALVTSRPVSAAKPDGTYSEAFAEGGKRVYDRTFPVMYLFTNEFGWEKNTNLSELTSEKAKDTINDKMRKDLKAAFELAIEQHPVEYYKDILKSFQEELIAQEEARKEAAATPKKGKKSKAKAADDEDTEMADGDASVSASAKKSKKRKAEDETSTPQRSDSVKKPKIKLNTSSTPKTANGAGTPKSAGAGSAAKAANVKPKKAKEAAEKKADTPKEPKMSPEERHKRKEKEVLYLRHKLQRGLLTREQEPKEDEMKSMSDYITMLENFVDLEVSIIRATKINKVLKAILKLDAVPREEEFQFKKRSQTLLDKWNKLLATPPTAPTAPTATSTNGVNGTSDAHADDKKAESNGAKEGSAADAKTDDAAETKKETADAGDSATAKPAAEEVATA